LISITGNLRVTGYGNFSGTVYINNNTNLLPPTCSGTDKLTFDGTSFSCSIDQSASGGSGIVASGNNSNGYYVQFADGTMIERGWNYVIGNNANYVVKLITYPVAFIENSYDIVGSSIGFKTDAGGNPPTNQRDTAGSDIQFMASVSSTNLTSATIMISGLTAGDGTTKYTTSTGQDYLFSWVAVGRWTSLTNVSVNSTTWAQNGNGDIVLFDTTKKVGIGTTSPMESLDINGTAGHILFSSDGAHVLFTRGSSNYIYANTTTGNLQFSVNGNGDSNFSQKIESNGNIYLAPSFGKVGIGTTSPSSKLDVRDAANQTARFTNNLAGATQSYILMSATSTSDDWQIGIKPVGTEGTDTFGFKPTAHSEVMTLLPTGKVGINTTNPQSTLDLSNASTAYYAPNASEPSAGTLHLVSNVTEWNVLNEGTSNTPVVLDLSSMVPSGTKAVLLLGLVQGQTTSGSGNSENYLVVRAGGSTSTARVLSNFISPGVAGVSYRATGQFTTAINSTRQIEYYINSVNQQSDIAYMSLVGYYI
jgi:hypothetical protein